MILYAPFYSVLVDSSYQAELEKRQFPSFKQLLKFLADEYHENPSVEELFISYCCYSKKLHNDVYVVSSIQIGSQKLNYPQTIGYFEIKY